MTDLIAELGTRSVRLMAKLLAGDGASLPEGPEVAAFMLDARHHGVVPLVQQSLHTRPRCFPRPDTALMEALGRIARAEAANVVAQDAVASLALRILAEADIPVLLVKGGALAYTHYRYPELRPRVDTDLLTAPDAFVPAVAALQRAGFSQLPALDAPLLMRQTTLQYQVGGGLRGSIDVHREINNRPQYAQAACFEELAGRARTLNLQGTPVNALDDADALMLASVHLAGHHPTECRLIWIYDLLLLVMRLGPQGLATVVARGGDGGWLPALAHGLRQVEALFSDCLAVELRTALSDLVRNTPRLAKEETRWHVLANDLKAIASVSERLRYLRQHLFPSPAYMHNRYGFTGRVQLPWLYLNRIGRGLAKLGRPLRQP